jgi:signal transduction histidine kinase
MVEGLSDLREWGDMEKCGHCHSTSAVNIARTAEKFDPMNHVNVRMFSSSGRLFMLDFLYPIEVKRSVKKRESVGLLTDENYNQPVIPQRIGTVCIGFSLRHVYVQIQRAVHLTNIATLVILIVGGVAAWVVGYYIVEPVRRLASATARIAKGELNEEIHVRTRDEIGELASSFNTMTRELKQTQSRLVQSGKMAAVGELAAGVAHELNNPLAGILGYAQYALEKMKKRTSDVVKCEDHPQITQYIEYIERESKRCKTIVQNLLKFSRASKTEMAEVDINDVIKETLIFNEHQLTINNILLNKNLLHNLPKVKGNANQLQQVFTNIVINAQKAMPGGGQLDITSRYVNGDSGSGNIEVDVRDTGCGIPKESLGKIFDPFFTTRKVGEGTGLGLSLSYGIIKDHGGEIKVKSEVNEGSTFTVILPEYKVSRRENESKSSNS